MPHLLSTSLGRLDNPAVLEETHLRRVLDILSPPGEETRLVGGAVRNALLGLPPGDIDLATTMVPAEVTRHAKTAKLRVIPTGIAHGTVTLMSGRHPFEVTTLREDIETDGRHAVVTFGRDFSRDAQRRDFTMNALSLGPDGEIFDTVGGIEDLAEGRVRFIGDAATRIREDFLRILRFFRFHATYGIGPLDSEGFEASTKNRDGLNRLSRERIRAEFFKILGAPGASEVLRAMRAAGILDIVIPWPANLTRFARLAETDADAALRLAALAIDDPGQIDALRERLRLTNDETKRLREMSRAVPALAALPDPVDDASLLRLLFAQGRRASIDAMLFRMASGNPKPYRGGTSMSYLQATPIPVFPFGGEELTRRGLKGPAVGKALAQLKERWAEAGFPTDPAMLESLLDQATS